MATDIYSTANKFRARLHAREQAVMRELNVAYDRVDAAAKAALDRVLAKLQAARDAGDEPKISWLYERDRLVAARRVIAVEMARLVPTAEDVIGVHRTATAISSASEALELLAEAFPAGVRPTFVPLQPDVVQQIAGQLTAGSPLRDLLAELGPELEQRITGALAEGISLGQSPLVIGRRIGDALDGNRARALTIARTEALRAHREVSHLAYRANADVVRGWLWWSSLDRTACASCLAMHGSWHSLEETLDAHPSCFPAGTLVAGPPAVAATSRYYRGELISVGTAAGHLLTGTPNHPIATPCGWVPLGLLKPGDEVLSSPVRQWSPSEINPNGEDRPALIEEVRETLRGAGTVTTRSMPGAAEQFHGDGSDSQVDVVAANGALRVALDAPISEPSLQNLFVWTDAELPSFTGARRLHSRRIRLSGTKREFSVGVERSHDPSMGLRRPIRGRNRILRETAAFDIGLTQAACHDRSRDPHRGGNRGLRFARPVPSDDRVCVHCGAAFPVESFTDESIPLMARSLEAAPLQFGEQATLREARNITRDRLGALPRDVTPDRVLQVRRRAFSGHVYNLQTEEGWYTASGIIVSNCRCTPIPDVRPEAGMVEQALPDSGAEHFARFPADAQRSILGAGKYDAYTAGDIDLVDVVERRSNPRWGTTRSESGLARAIQRHGTTNVDTPRFTRPPERLPQRDRSQVVDRLARYALAADPNKARKWRSALGFGPEDAGELARRIETAVATTTPNISGRPEGWVKYRTIVPIDGLNGLTAEVLVAWQTNHPGDPLRLITAVPRRRAWPTGDR